MRILCVSTPVGFLGSGEGGGLELTVRNVVHSLSDRNHSIAIIAPQGSQSAHGQVIEVAGALPPLAQHYERTTPVSITDIFTFSIFGKVTSNFPIQLTSSP
jgi:UDP-glucose:tetrahydrobiopterin glucosyltransferase